MLLAWIMILTAILTILVGVVATRHS